MANIFDRLKQRFNNIFYVPAPNSQLYPNDYGKYSTVNSALGGSEDETHNISRFIAPVPALRIKQDTANWRGAINEAERPILPFRYLMQIAFMDTILDGHILATMERRKNLTLLKDWRMVDENGNIDEYWTRYFDEEWFRRFLNFSLDAIFYGYSLISMGDIVDGKFVNITNIRRSNISPDRYNVAPVPYSPSGVDFLTEPYCDWHIWVSTPNEHGLSSCGYGLLYPITNYAILLKNNLIYNSEYVEVYGMPFRQLKTDKKNEEERRMAQATMENMASNGYAVTGLEDEIIFHDVSKGGAYKCYGDLENRVHKTISKIILGHSDTMDSTPGRLGAAQGGDNSPIMEALEDIQSTDAHFILPIINEKLIPLMRKHGILVPENLTFVFSNDKELEETTNKRNAENLKIANTAKIMMEAGLKIDPEYFTKTTGIVCTEVNIEPTEADVTSEKAKQAETSQGIEEVEKKREDEIKTDKSRI